MRNSPVERAVKLFVIFLTCFMGMPAFAVTAGHVDDFEDGTTQGWEEGAGLGTPNPNPPTNVANGGPTGAGDNFLENVSTGGAGSGSKQIIFNTGANWTGDFATAGINVIRLDVQVNASSEGPLQLRIAFEGTNGAQFASTNAVAVPDDGAWHTVELPVNESTMSQIAGVATLAQTFAGVAEMRLMHRPAGPGWTASAFSGLVGYDNISTLAVSTFSGWVWATGVSNSPSAVELWEEYCFGPLSLGIDSDDNWTVLGGDACVGRITTNNDPARAYDNYDPGTGTIPFVEPFYGRSTRPLVSADGNLFELFGEDVDMGVGQGEGRFGTVLAEPSDSSLLIVGAYETYADPNYAESYGEVDLLVKDSPDVRATRFASDLEGLWYGSFFNRFVSRNNIQTNVSATGLRVLDLQAGGICEYFEPAVIPDPEVTSNGDFFSTAQIEFGGGLDLTDRGVFAGVAAQRTRSDCTYQIDGDGYLSIQSTSTNNTQEPPVQNQLSFSFVVSDDNNYLVPAPDPGGVEEDFIELAVRYRAPSALTADSIDGMYLFYLNITDHDATGTAHTAGWTGSQLYDVFGRGSVSFDSTIPGTPPQGYAGDWYACDIDLVVNDAEYQANGQPGLGQVWTSLELTAERQSIACDYNLAADGSLLMNLLINDPGEPVEGILFAGYVNHNAEFLTLVDLDTGIENPGSAIGSLVDFSSVRHITAMKYTGDPDGDGDGDGNSNFEEFVSPVPPVPFTGIVSLGDINGNGSSDIGIAIPGSTWVQIRDGSTDDPITDIDFGTDLAVDMMVLPDLDASGDPEIAILQQQPSGQVRVQARDSITGLVTSNLWYGAQYQAVSMAMVPDYNGNGFPEVAVLGSEAGTDAVRVQLKDSDTTTTLDNIFLGTQSRANDLVSLSDTNGNNIPEIGILGVLKANDQVRMQVWDPVPPLVAAAEFQTNVWFAKVYQPHSTITMPDINSNGSDEIVAMGVDPVTQNIRVQVRDSDTTATHYNIWLGAVNEAVDIAMINDINGNGFADIAVLLKRPDGTGRVRVQDGMNGAFIRNLFYTVVDDPVGLAVLPDYSGNGFDELAVLGTSAGVRHVQILDTSSGAQVNRIDFP